jgi:hypothetical protein
MGNTYKKRMESTYRDLKTYLDSMPDKRLDDNVTVRIMISGGYEFFPVKNVRTVRETDVLEIGHVFLEV